MSTAEIERATALYSQPGNALLKPFKPKPKRVRKDSRRVGAKRREEGEK
jgi:hypothetical protein